MINKNLIKNLIKINLVLFWLFMCWFIGNHAHANKEYEYTNLDIIWDIKTDGTIDVKEDFTTYFYVQKHGIMREIPLNYTVNGYPFHIDIKNINVSWKKFTASTDKNIVSIKIWDANKYVYWTQNYPIFYSVYGLIRNFSWMWYAELYRNIVWNEFDTSINKVSAILYLPKVYTWFTSGDFLIAADGKSNKIEDFEWTLDRSQWDKIILTYNKKIPAWNGITLSVKFPNNYFVFDDKRQSSLVWNTNNNKLNNNSDNWIYFSIKFQDNKFDIDFNKQNNSIVDINGIKSFNNINPGFLIVITLFTLFILGVIYKLVTWLNLFNIIPGIKPIKKLLSKIKFKSNHSVVTQFAPPQSITPSEMSFLYYNKFCSNAISSMIYKRASEWRVLIAFKKGPLLVWDSVLLMQWKDIARDLKWFEQKAWESLIWVYDREKFWYFSKKDNAWNSVPIDYKMVAELPNMNFSSNVYKIQSLIQKSCEEQWLIKIKTLKKTIKCLLKIILFLTLILEIFLLSFKPFIICFIILTLWIFYFINNYTKKELTNEGNKILSEIYGYKKFLENCEEEQLKFLIKEDPNYIDKILPYAIALWLETKLIDMVKPIYEETWRKITWYYDDFSSLSSTINTISSSVKYKSDSGFNSGSSFDSDSWSWGGGWSSGGWGWGGWWHSR